jgi:hypothetical protein
VVEDPGEEDASGKTPAGGVAQFVGLSLLGELPESGQVHFKNNYLLIRWPPRPSPNKNDF